MVKIIEMDTHTTFMKQLAGSGSEPIVLANLFTMSPEDEASFLELWAEDAKYMLSHGCVSGQLHKGTEGSTSYLNYAVWESVEALARAFRSEQFQSLLHRYPSSVSASPHVFTKFAVPGVCDD
ncbi:antibiotic biosynthesis monooxygenase family protein [Nocardia salmonicida]|uniref:antibiotic biosynthesis monooxygenase family protein n=1 Tax=Nocardia salmonicida TaxID=53431 RepID=UPI0007A55D3E|nr:antibiotic biosynthesis monooxygenase family protein [Nocardia salmonicida]